MSVTRVVAAGEAYDFGSMEVGEVRIYLAPEAQQAAHAYGHKYRKRFTTRKVINKQGECGIRIERLADSAPKRAGAATRGRRKYPWPFYKLEENQTWTCRDPEACSRVISAVNNENRRHGRRVYSVRTVIEDLTYKAVHVTRVG